MLLVRGLGGTASARDTGLALACGACIAGYTLTDSYGLRHAAPVPYLECVLALTVLVYVPVMARLKGGRATAAAEPRIAVAGCASSRPTRSCSRRLAGAAVVVAGITALA